MMNIEKTVLAEIKRLIDPEASEVDPIEPMEGNGWATAYRSGDRIFRLFYSPKDGYESFLVGSIRSDRSDRLSLKERQAAKRRKVFDEWQKGTLNIGKSTKTVPRSKAGHKQAVAIALSESAKVKRKDAITGWLKQHNKYRGFNG